MRAFYINPLQQRFEVRDVNPSYEHFRKVIDCDRIDIVTRKIGGHKFDIVCDDDALATHPYIAAIDKRGNPMLVGPMLIFGASPDASMSPITIAEIQHLVAYLRMLPTRAYPAGLLMLTHMDY